MEGPKAFARSGANISLDEVARQAHIGAGTLYRHFPTRDSLLEAVYRTEVEKLAAAEREFGESMPPAEALRAWMLLFVDYRNEQIIAPALNNIVGGPSKLFETTGAQIKGAINALVKRAIESATSGLTSIHSICSGRSSGFPTWPPGWIGCKAPKDWCTFSFSARVRSPRPLTNFPNPFGCRQPVSA